MAVPDEAATKNVERQQEIIKDANDNDAYFQQILQNFSDSTDTTTSTEDTSIGTCSSNEEEAKEKLFEAWRRSSNNSPQGAATTTAVVDLDAVSKVYAPRHLHKQFQELYNLLHPCLVRRNRNNNNNQQQQQRASLSTTTAATASAAITNRSAFLQGARGSGKSLVLQRCLQAFHDELNIVKQQQAQNQQHQQEQQQQQQQPSFRIVRIHGILVPGTKVEVVVQEILQQLTRSAYQQGNKSRITKSGSSSTKDATTQKQRPSNSSEQEVENISNEKKKSKRQKTTKFEKDNDIDDDDSNDDSSPTRRRRQQQQQVAIIMDRKKKDKSMEHLLRLRKTSFTNHFQLLNEILQYACLDGIPILFILDELDAFVSGGGGSNNGGGGGNKQNNTDGGAALTVVNKERQVLLYYLLDRVATQGSFLSLVGLSCHLRTAELLEKRVLSRAMGTARFIGFGPPRTFTHLAEILQDKFKVSSSSLSSSDSENAEHNGHSSSFVSTLQSQVAQLLSEPPLHEEQQNEAEESDNKTDDSCSTAELQQQRRRLYEALERSFRLGKDLRWFSRVFTLALALYRLDCRSAIAASATTAEGTCNDTSAYKNSNSNVELPPFRPQYLLEALVDMGASFLTASGEPDLLASHRYDGATNSGSNGSGGIIYAAPRIQALHDLCGPQIVLVLAAKRILTRDVQYSTTTTFPPPLTFQRMWQEYNTTYRGNTNRYGRALVLKAFQELVAVGLLRPAMDHSGTVPLQYDYHGEFSFSSSSSSSTLTMLPLHFNIDIYREMQKAIDANVLDCPAALREWGKKTH